METSTKKTRSGVSHGGSSKPLKELLRVCKPLFIKMTRLPASAIDKHAASGLAPETKPKPRLHKSWYSWRRGYTTVERRRKRRRAKCQQILQSEKSESAANNHTSKGEQINPERTSPSKILNPNDLVRGSSAEKQSAGQKEDSTSLNETQSETHRSSPSSNAQEVSSGTTSNDELPNAKVVMVEEPETNIVDPSSDLFGIRLRRSIVRDMAKRKRPLRSIEPESEESNRSSQDLKKLKPLDEAIAPCDDKASPASPKKKEIVAKRVKPSKIEKQNPKSVRRRMRKQREARVVLCRLEDSLDPVIRQWNEKSRLLGDPGATESLATPIEKLIEERSQLADKDKLSGQALPESETCDLATTNAVPNTCMESRNFTPLDEVTKTSGPSTNSDDENDEEVMEFLRSPKKIIPLIDSSSSDSMSYYEESRDTPPARKITRSQTAMAINAGGDSEEMATSRRYMTRNAKTPSITRSITSPVRTRPETRMSRMLRLAKEFAEEIMDSESSPNDHGETPKSPRSRGQEPKKTPSLRQIATRGSIDSEASISVVEPRSPRKKSSRSVIEDSSSESTYNPGEALTDMYDDEVPSPIPTRDQPKSSEATTNNPRVDEDENGPEAMTEVNCDTSPMDPSNSSTQRNDVLTARKKLTAPNAMVVLTRLNDLDDISDRNGYSDSEMELRTAEDSDWPRERSSATANPTSDNSQGVDAISNDNETADPLDIDTDNVSAPSETITPFAAVFCRTFRKLRTSDEATRSSPRKLPRVDYFPNEEVDSRWSQDTAESDVELSLILEESERMHEESLDRTSRIGDSSMDSPCTPSDGVLTETNGNPCRVQDGDDLAQVDDHRLVRENIALTHKCVICSSLFKNAELLTRHRASSAACKPDLRCTTCQTTLKTTSELAKHLASCHEKTSEKRSIDDPDNDHIPPENYASVWLPSKSDPKKSQGHKKSSKKSRKGSRLRGDNPICNVCSKNFGTTQALSEHIYKHSKEELQEAYRVCKAKMMADFATKRALEASAEAGNVNEVAGPGVDVDGATSTEKAQVTLDSRGNGVVTGADRDALAAAVCPCHRQTQANTEENDLQIEMVLLCQHCHVLFRRRECFEVHYRTSSRCANDRKRGRWPRLFCASCQLTLNSWADMRHHLEVHASVNAEGTVRFVCNICRVVFVGFGALFYYHWFSHLRDTMFVASRHTFPKISVQPIDGLAKLPIGAAPEESYIWVAEHVCADCRKPFSTRRDLELHRETDSCVKIVSAPGTEVDKDTTETNDSLWYCDVCEIVFDDRDQLNDHGADRHGRHYTCVSTSPKQKTFMCTKCCAMRKRVRDIEEHWKSHPQHNLCHFEMENGVTARPDDDDVAKDNEVVGNSSSTKNSCETGSSSLKDSTTITKNRASLNEAETSQRRADKAYAGPAIDVVFHAAGKNPESHNRAARTANEKSSIAETRTESTSRTESTILSNLLRGTPSAGRSSDKQKTRVGALEDPFVNVVMSDSSNEKLSASLVIDESHDKSRDATGVDSHTESYQILMMDSNPKSNSGPIKMVFSRKSAANPAGKLKQPRTSESKKEKVSLLKNTAIDEGGAKEATNQSSHNKTTGGSIDGKSGKTTSRKKKNDSSRKPKDNQANVSLPTSSNEKSIEPEVIDIVEEIEIPENANDVPTGEISSIKVSPSKSTTKPKPVVKNKKSSVIKLHKGVESMKIGSAKGSKKKSSQNGSSGSEMLMSFNDSGKFDLSDAAGLARRAQRLSFEEARYELLSKNSDESAASRRQGLIRVKDLSELQAVKQHVCRVCSATFESSASLDEHKLLHFPNTVVNESGNNLKGITAALVLPAPSENHKTPVAVLASNNTGASSQSYVPQRFATVTPGPITNTTGVVRSSESWMCNSNQQNSQISGSLTLNVANGLSTILSKYNVNPEPAKSVITSTAGIAQPQQTYVVQSQPLIGYLTVPDVNRQLPEARNPGQMGFHVLPAMVAPSSQSNRQHTAVASQQNSSSNNLPTSGLAVVAPLTSQQINGLNKFVCTICRTFRCDTIEAFNEHVNKHLVGFNSTTASRGATQTIPTVIVPQSSSFATVNQVVTNTIADNATIGNKTTGERLVVNNWIVSNPASLWTTSNFSQQSGSSVQPITTQSILPSTVQITNGKVANSTASATIWTPPVYNQSVSSSVDTIIKESLVSPTPQNSNNNNGTALKPSGWPVSTFNGTGDAGGQIVYQCTICKSASYTDQEHLRRHILIVHDVENLSKYVMDNTQKTYYCNRCPNGTAPFDMQSKLRIHQETDHSNCCPFCNQNFGSHMFLNDHMEHCPASNSHTNFEGNC